MGRSIAIRRRGGVERSLQVVSLVAFDFAASFCLFFQLVVLSFFIYPCHDAYVDDAHVCCR